MSKASPFPFPQARPASRTVRQLDRAPGEAPAIEVAGFQIKSDVPAPVGRRFGARVRAALEALEVGQHFDAPRGSRATIYRVTGEIQTKEFTVKQVDGGLRIWRIL